ncbi:IclR family transcriptional regulator [Tamlana sp. 2_MG-2023]|uniref:IclR family transcriptional regulator n=1 Tax=unclassified Tamlana TaxID=2614803 RepID=UPI0026E252CD|nr:MULTISPECIES: IclR family transcriptional regulator [unclassified Tamlana]MDO6761313.1 IclR family transcriptional regulator [Tamlana sp. 2_MG-2023]MDO6791796.1 IclR family transcriptional regulator [Tamlana sp. 1_MG-2023]
MSKYVAPALDKGLDILEYLSEIKIPQSQGEIAQGLNKSPNELYRMLVCLEQRGYLIKSLSSGKYALSLKLYQLSHRHSPIDGLLKSAKPVIEELANVTNQSCHLSMIYQGKLMVVSQMRSPGPVSLSIEEGSLFPLTKTASGRVLMAFLDSEKTQRLLEDDAEFSTLSKKDQKAFLLQLDSIKTNGHEISQSDLTMGVTDIAVPVGNPDLVTYCALAISSLTSINEKNKSGAVFIDKLLEASNTIKSLIGEQ